VLRYAVFAAIGFVVLVLILGAQPQSQKGKDRQVIELCWQDHERKSLDPGTKRFIAGTCEMMEQRFKERHGHAP